ncbi:TPA: siphovirus ReqiPepy6 Gp37-like family protein [Clostridium botulinum]|nr:siphovirus ReqiPepy6 Gp37-like family protein [Clostridium botulinum]HDK7193259.1 siphovirus ReqiPepy6 Gp37-like family protein [Clostridium botulinum]HDK7205109.1 siphovirus ReqiPepy6 Gp37-like family protein [Clostridium botulinum]HDK7209129.1 siphovirus ReqiPepy6 Gp37-like family protein [Clostridium botulinum]HDK7264289.1 siphovirus ReqiPepy6 Gp37-like family protein [Clostridium botulinum]
MNLLGVLDTYESFTNTRRFYNYGEFELRISANKPHVDKLIKNNLILLGKAYNKVGIVLHREFNYQQGGENTDLLLIKGITLQGLTKRRRIVPPVGQDFDSCIGNQETIIKYFVDKNCINPLDSKRKIDNLILAEDKKRGNEDRWRGSYENLADKLQTIGEYSKLGWNISLDHKQKKFIFDVMQGRNLTVNQNTNPPVIFRSDFNNIFTRHYIESIINSSNVAYTGTREDKDKIVLQIGEATGFERIETFVDCNSDDAEEINQTGKAKLQEFKEIKTFNLDVNPLETFVYEKDYDLGDIVTIQDRKLKITMDSQITEIQEQYGKEGLKLKVTFGSSIPTLLTAIKRMVR